MKNLTKKLLAAVVVVIFAAFLNSCGGGTATTTSSLKTYEGGDFTINVDPTWKVVTKSDFYADIPQETVVAFTTPEAYDGFFINVNVVKEDLKQEVAAVDYARANINQAGQNLTDYNKVQEAKMDLGGSPTLIHIFEARLNPTEKLIRFVQLYATKGKYGYIVTGGMLPDTPQNIRDGVGSMVTSFKLK